MSLCLAEYLKVCCRLQRMFVRNSSFIAPTRPTISVTDEKSAIVEVCFPVNGVFKALKLWSTAVVWQITKQCWIRSFYNCYALLIKITKVWANTVGIRFIECFNNITFFIFNCKINQYLLNSKFWNDSKDRVLARLLSKQVLIYFAVENDKSGVVKNVQIKRIGYYIYSWPSI